MVSSQTYEGKQMVGRMLTELQRDELRLTEIDRLQEEALEKELIQVARNRYCTDEIEIDDAPSVSYGDDGVFIQAWVWVAFDEVDNED